MTLTPEPGCILIASTSAVIDAMRYTGDNTDMVCNLLRLAMFRTTTDPDTKTITAHTTKFNSQFAHNRGPTREIPIGHWVTAKGRNAHTWHPDDITHNWVHVTATQPLA